MKNQYAYQVPGISSRCLSRAIVVALSGANALPSNPIADCANAFCNFGTISTFDVKVSWNDDPGTDVCSYVVKASVSPDGQEYFLKDEDCASGISGCQMTENPVNSGQYSLNCEGVPTTGSGCLQCEPDVITVISISDGVNHLPVGKDCTDNSINALGC